VGLSDASISSHLGNIHVFNGEQVTLWKFEDAFLSIPFALLLILLIPCEVICSRQGVRCQKNVDTGFDYKSKDAGN
jgi:hypothetical protein